MTVKEVIENELKCVQRDCCRLENECAKCDLVLPKEEIINAYNKALKLETENAELKDKLKNLESVAEVRLANWQKCEEENKELKAINEGYCRSRDRLASIGLPTFMSCKETVNKLKEAKEIIKRLMDIINHDLKCFDTMAGLDIKQKAEQFLKECE